MGKNRNKNNHRQHHHRSSTSTSISSVGSQGSTEVSNNNNEVTTKSSSTNSSSTTEPILTSACNTNANQSNLNSNSNTTFNSTGVSNISITSSNYSNNSISNSTIHNNAHSTNNNNNNNNNQNTSNNQNDKLYDTMEWEDTFLNWIILNKHYFFISIILGFAIGVSIGSGLIARNIFGFELISSSSSSSASSSSGTLNSIDHNVIPKPWQIILGKRIRASMSYQILTLQRSPLHLPILQKTLSLLGLQSWAHKHLYYSYYSSPHIDPQDPNFNILHTPYNYITIHSRKVRDDPSHPLAFAVLREAIVREEGGFVHPDLGLLIPAPSGAARGLGMVRSSFHQCQTRCMPGIAAEKLLDKVDKDYHGYLISKYKQQEQQQQQQQQQEVEDGVKNTTCTEIREDGQDCTDKNHGNDSTCTNSDKTQSQSSTTKSNPGNECTDGDSTSSTSSSTATTTSTTTATTNPTTDDLNSDDKPQHPPWYIPDRATRTWKGLQRILDQQHSNPQVFRQEEVLLRIPLEYQMTRTLALHTLMPIIPSEIQLRAPLQELDDAALLVLLLAHERGLGRNSVFLPYIATLPLNPACGYNPILRPQALESIAVMGLELNMDVHGWSGELSKASDRAELIAEGLAKDYGPYIKTPPGEIPFITIQWALCQVASRATAGSDKHGALRLIPMLDMINHDVNAGGFHELNGHEKMENGHFVDSYEEDSGTFVVRSLRYGRRNPLKKGQELLVNYNVPNYSPFDWFISLGFVPPERAKKWTMIDAALPKIRTYGSDV